LIQWLTALGAAAIYVQIVLGANLRHVAPDAAPWWFTLWVWLHVIVACLIVLLVLWQFVAVKRHAADQPVLGRRILLLSALFSIQLALGITTWITNYGWPLWFTQNILAVEYTVVAESFWQAVSTTAHVGVGSLCLAAATSAALWSRRLLESPLHSPSSKSVSTTKAPGGHPKRNRKR
jgi:cytochrome c oxidase assembly protein subunit 15